MQASVNEVLVQGPGIVPREFGLCKDEVLTTLSSTSWEMVYFYRDIYIITR